MNKAAAKIKALVLDVDGVLTDGSLTFDEEGKEYKFVSRFTWTSRAIFKASS